MNNISSFEDYLINEGKSESTVSNYLIAVRKFINWYYRTYQHYPDTLTEKSIHEFEKVHSDKSAQTINIYLHGLRKYNDYLIEQGKMDFQIINSDLYKPIVPKLRTEKDIKKEDIELFFQTILNDTSRDRKFTNRDYLIAKMITYLGLSVADIIKFNIEDIDIIKRVIMIKQKQKKEKVKIQLNDELTRLLDRYFEKTRTEFPNYHETDLLFMNRSGKPLSRKTIYYDFKQYSEKAGLDVVITPSDLKFRNSVI